MNLQRADLPNAPSLTSVSNYSSADITLYYSGWVNPLYIDKRSQNLAYYINPALAAYTTCIMHHTCCTFEEDIGAIEAESLVGFIAQLCRCCMSIHKEK